jgi:hypothetical protein
LSGRSECREGRREEVERKKEKRKLKSKKPVFMNSCFFGEGEWHFSENALIFYVVLNTSC